MNSLEVFSKAILDIKKAYNYRKEEVFSKNLISFSSNDYLNLSENTSVEKKAIEAIKKYGVGAKSSKFIEGFNEFYVQIAKEMNEMKQTEDCLIFSSGYTCNIGIFSSLADKCDIIFFDEFSHASSFEGAKLSGAKIIRYKHNDISDLALKMKKFSSKGEKIFIATETVFSMKGTVLENSAEYVHIAKKYGAILITDEAHSFGVLEFDFPKYDLHLKMGTFSKAVGVLGGYVCGKKEIIDVIRNLAKSGIYTTALPPSVLASVLASLKLIKTKKVTSKKALANAMLFGKIMNIEMKSQIAFLECETSENAMQISKTLEVAGFFVKAIRTPTVPKAGIRISFNNLHKKVDIENLCFMLRKFF
jgi:7-keto-8-aminopelargonate synthetase-like enzyme